MRTQCQRVLDRLLEAKGEWINGRTFLHDMFLSQYHARILELQRKGYKIEASPFLDEFGFKAYRLITEPLQTKLEI